MVYAAGSATRHLWDQHVVACVMASSGTLLVATGANGVIICLPFNITSLLDDPSDVPVLAFAVLEGECCCLCCWLPAM